MKLPFLQRVVAAALLLVAGTGWASAEPARLVIITKSGTVVEFLLADSPVITFQNNLLEVKGGGKEITVEADALGTFDFVPSENSGIDEIAADRSSFSGLRPGTAVEVYTPDGRCVATFKADGNGSASVGLGNLAPGYYIVRTPSASFKIKKN